jgi:hypothetical protein
MSESIVYRIYKITSPTTNNVYIGSTKCSLRKRLGEHYSDFKAYNRRSASRKRYCTSYEIIKNGDAIITELHNFTARDRNEVLKVEGTWISATENCINKIIAGRTPQEYSKVYYWNNKEQLNKINKEYRTENKQQLKIKKREYNRINKEQINKKRSVKCECECGKSYTKRHKARHMKTKYHILYESDPIAKAIKDVQFVIKMSNEINSVCY